MDEHSWKCLKTGLRHDSEQAGLGLDQDDVQVNLGVADNCFGKFHVILDSLSI